MTDQPDLDVVNLGMMMVEISPPRLGVSIAESETLSLHIAGSANIFGNALARLGGKIGLISRVGDDQLGEWLREQAQAAGMDTSAVAVVAGQLTPLLLASVDHHGNKTFAFYRFPGTCDPLATYRAEETPDNFLRRGRVFDLAEGSLRHPELRREAMILTRRARELGCTICFSPNYREAAWAGGAAEASAVLREALALADLVILNESEAILLEAYRERGFPVTIVRPSHTVRTGMPLAIGDGDAVARRLLRGAPVIVHGDGTSLWTVTRCVDFAVPFVRLLGNAKALGDDFQITNNRAFTWDEITKGIAAGLGVEAKIVHVPTDTLIRYNKEWEGPLLGDKSWSALFDNSKVKGLVGDFSCAQDLPTILEDSIANFKARNKSHDQSPHALDALMDRICKEQAALGA